MAFTAALLGTDTVFTPQETVDYDRGESLSIASSLIEGGECTHTSPEPYIGRSIHVIEGPDTLGTAVHDRISRAVLSILHALARGETQINIMAFSRGAVEAILVAHELERIVNLFKQRPFHHAGITNSTNPATEAQMRGGALGAAFNALIQQLQSNPDDFVGSLSDVKLAIFNIDPVPGGRWMGAPTRWVDDRFYHVPSIVSEYTQYVYENESSRSFKAIIPKPVDPSQTIYHLHTIPGHHGTGSGNFLNQSRQVNDAWGEDKTSHVQEIILINIIEFLRRHGHDDFKTKDRVTINHKLEALLYGDEGSTLLDARELAQKKLLCYAAVAENKKSYQLLSKHTFVTGHEQTAEGLIDTAAAWVGYKPGFVVEDRLVHYHRHSSVNTFLRQVIPTQHVGYVNAEHAHLAFQQIYDHFEITDIGASPVMKVGRVLSGLRAICDYEKTTSPTGSPVPGDTVDFGRLPVNGRISHLLKISQLDTGLFPRFAAFFIEEVAHGYLNGQMGIAEKAQMVRVIIEGMSAFQGLESEFTRNIYQSLEQSLHLALSKKSDIFFQELNRIDQDLSINIPHVEQGLLGDLSNMLKASPLDLVINHKIECFIQELARDVRLATPREYLEKINQFYSNLLDDPQEYQEKSKLLNLLKTAGDTILRGLDPSRVLREAMMLYDDFDRHLESLDAFNKAKLTRIKLLPHFSRKAVLLSSIAIYSYQHHIEAGELYNRDAPCIREMEPYLRLLKEQDPIYRALQDSAQQNGVLTAAQTVLEEERRILAYNTERLAQQNRELIMAQAALENEHRTLAQNAERLTHQNGELAAAQVLLEEERRILAQDTERLTQQNEELIAVQAALKAQRQQDNAPKEAQCLDLITDKLLPLTTRYLAHLRAQAPGPENNAKIGILDAVKTSLELALQPADLENPRRNQDCVINFYTALDASNQDITLHQDPAWKRYVLNVVIALSIVITGFLPGLAVLGIVSMRTGKSPKFWQSEGQTFFESCQQEKPSPFR